MLRSPLANIDAKAFEPLIPVLVKYFKAGRLDAYPYNLVPTASTTAMLALGDAMAISLLKERGFKN